jgi:NIMA (never in mitosis gene a)-related kinase
VLTRLGEGAFSVVYKVKRKEDGKEYAMKKMRIMNLSEK